VDLARQHRQPDERHEEPEEEHAADGVRQQCGADADQQQGPGAGQGEDGAGSPGGTGLPIRREHHQRKDVGRTGDAVQQHLVEAADRQPDRGLDGGGRGVRLQVERPCRSHHREHQQPGRPAPLLAGEQHRGGDMLTDVAEVGVGERAAERELLAALDGHEHERLTKPLASSVPSMWRSSSSLVMWPMIPMWVSVARSGALRTIVCSALPSQALRTTGERVLPSRESTFMTWANSDSTTRRRLSG
jgi:hypothetical protein